MHDLADILEADEESSTSSEEDEKEEDDDEDGDYDEKEKEEREISKNSKLSNSRSFEFSNFSVKFTQPIKRRGVVLDNHSSSRMNQNVPCLQKLSDTSGLKFLKLVYFHNFFSMVSRASNIYVEFLNYLENSIKNFFVWINPTLHQ